MNQFCPTPENTCTDPANPISNFSAEAPDEVVFIGRSYSTVPPPLGGIWYASSCVGRVTSTISQQDADDRAAQAAVTCLPYVTPQPNPDPDPDPGEPPYIFVPNPTYTNDEQQCESDCADGSKFTATVAAGTVTAFNLATANAQALSLACNRVITGRICIGDLARTSACLGDSFDETITFEIATPPAQVAVISGALPPGLTLVFAGGFFATSFSITGTATGVGAYTFTIRVNDQQGNYNDKTFTINVATIANTVFPDGAVGTAYSQGLLYLGAVNGAVQWAVTAGALPDGLSLNTLTGVISGTPTTAGTATFTITMTDGF
jgi:hypothetical protein